MIRKTSRVILYEWRVIFLSDSFRNMSGSYVSSGQRNWYKLCGWNVRIDKERYTRGILTLNRTQHMIEQNCIWRKCGNVKNLCPFPFFQASGGLKAFGNYLAEDYFFAQVRNTWYLKCNLNCNKRNILNVICHLCNWMMSLLDMPNMCLHTFIYYVIACLKYLGEIVGRVIHDNLMQHHFYRLC